jgi:hypothetical protein
MKKTVMKAAQKAAEHEPSISDADRTFDKCVYRV